MAVLFRPLPDQLRKGGGIENRVDSSIGPIPQLSQRRTPLPAYAGFLVAAAFYKTKYSTHRDRIRAFCQQIPTLGTPAGFDESALFQAGENEFQELLWDLLPTGDVGDLNGFVSGL